MNKEQGLIRVKKRREMLRITFKEMAGRLHMSTSGYFYIEKGKRRLTVERAIEIADALHVHPSELFPEFFYSPSVSRNEK